MKPPVPAPHRSVSSQTTLAAAAAVAICGWFLWTNFDKGLWFGIQGWGRPYWWLDYRHGFVRRGLVGSIFQMVMGRLPEERLITPVMVVHLACSAFLGGALLWMLFGAVRSQVSQGAAVLTAALGLWIAVAELWPTIAYNQGYLDVIVLVVAVAAALLVRRRWYIPAGVLLFAGPFIHEYFLFLAPFVLLAEQDRYASEDAGADNRGLLSIDAVPDHRPLPRHLFILAAIVVVAGAITMLAANREAARLEIAAMPMGPEFKTILVKTTLMQTLTESFGDSASQMVRSPSFTARTFTFFLLPTFISVAAMLFWRGSRPSVWGWARAAAALFPIAALLIAWDLSRLLVMSNLTAGLLFLMSAQDGPAGAAPLGKAFGWRGILGCVLAPLALLYGVAPLAYVYYEPGPATLFPLRVWPGDGERTFGLRGFWSNAHIVVAKPPEPSVRAPGMLHDLHGSSPDVREESGGWRLPARPAQTMVLFGPYRDLPGGDQRLRMQIAVDGSPEECRAFRKDFHAAIAVTRDAGKGELQAQSPLGVSAPGSDPCRLKLETVFSVPSPGAAKVETPLYVSAPRSFLLDGYELEPAAPAQSR